MPCALSLVACVQLQRTIYLSLQASSRLIDTLTCLSWSLDPDHVHDELAGPSEAQSWERLKSKRPFVSAARKIIHDLFELDIRAAQWTDYKWSTEYLFLNEHIWSLCLHFQDQANENGPNRLR